ncbi:AIPR protein [Streptomyces sp. 2333.5]|uniref:AIPR family protein n=1 Tax=Streptomyces TaxID=1883 RepID=UPI0008983736|nr:MULTISPECIES: AIPR family protein [unclassified Streptomyces]PJJ02025.1 AIPR protein [Streptomyces sp. 2333.5]SEC92193.1 AIPR protein [Streptomyces sp. 2314.4]SED77854.1 AIPR protein [Streptomyces sp. 2112.2]
MASTSNDQRLLDRVLEDQHSRLAPNQKLDDFFNYFTASTALQDLDLDIDELRDGIVDGSHDCGIDGIWVLVDDRYVSADIARHTNVRAGKIELVILQAKTSSGYQETAFEKLHYHLPLLLDMDRDVADLAQSTNAKLLDRTGRFLNVLEALASSFPKVFVRVIYASRAAEGPHPNVRAKGNRLAAELAKIASETKCSVEYLGAAELRALSARGAVVVSELVFTETPMSTSLGEGYVCLARLDEYYKFITSPNEALRLELFESNVRDYAGRTSVNTEIGETLKSNHREDFWWFNNGVTIVAEEVRIAGKKIVMKDPQIVNGLQTSHEIYKYFQDPAQYHRERCILVRIMVPPKSGRARDAIIRATNSQTQLPPGALRATEQIQKDIEESLQRDSYYYERRANYYKNLGFRLEQVVSMSRLAREYTAFVVGEPHMSLKLSESLLLDDSHYYKVFSTENDLDLYRLVLDVHIRISDFLNSYSEFKTLLGDTSENWRYHLAYMARFTLTRLRRPTQRDFLNVKIEHLSDELLEQMTGLLDRTYRASLRGNRTKGIDRVARSGDFTHQLRQATVSLRRFKIDH